MVIAIVGFLLYLSPFITTGTKTENHSVPPLQTLTLTFHFNKGEKIEGYFTVRQGNDDINFYVKDPYGTVILDAGRVKGRYDFVIPIEHSGVYTLYFDNTFSLFTSKTIFLTYQATIRSFFSELSLPITLIGVSLIVLGLILIYEKKMKEK